MKINGILFEEDKSVEVYAVRVGPEQAKVALENMTANQRKTSHLKVREYAKEMIGLKWKVSNDAAVICGDVWLNAKHRMEAIVQSGTTQTLLLLNTLDESIIRVIDGGKPRRISDVLKMDSGISYSSQVAGVGTHLLAYERGLLTSGGTNRGSGPKETISMKRLVTSQDRIEFCLRRRNDLLEAVLLVTPLANKYGALLTVLYGAVVFCIIKKADGEKAALDFLNPFYSGDEASGVIKQLRVLLIRDSQSRNKMLPVRRLGTALKAYIAHRSGIVPGQLMLKGNEEFPKV